jgi:hypothetical protein
MERDGKLGTGIPARLSAHEGRKFGITVGLAFLTLTVLLWWRDRGPIVLGILSSLAGLFLAGGLLVPTRLGPLQRAWMGLAMLISRITTPVIMAILFFMVFLPIGLLMRAFGRNPLRRPGGSTAATFWARRNPEAGRSELARQF